MSDSVMPIHQARRGVLSSKLGTLLKQRSLQTFLLLGLYLCFSAYLSEEVHRFFYTVSLFIKDLLLWMMPLTVGFFIAYTVSSFEKKAPLFIITILLFETLSNFSSVWYAYGTAEIANSFLPPIAKASFETTFEPLWRFPFSRPTLWSAEKGALVGLALGYISTFGNQPALRRTLTRGKSVMEWLLTRVFSRLIPLFILGFAAQMIQTNLLMHVVSHYALLTLWLAGFIVFYILFLFALGSGFSPSVFFRSVRNLLPAGGIALTSGCSLSTMPWTIQGAAKNLDDLQLASGIIPATTNIQQIGDCITNAFLVFLIYTHFNGAPPDLATWGLFSIVFVLARFATAAVLGGAIFIMIPIYETYLNFTPEMIAIILALNVVLDPLVTSSNVVANGALCRIFERVWNFVPSFLYKLKRA